MPSEGDPVTELDRHDGEAGTGHGGLVARLRAAAAGLLRLAVAARRNPGALGLALAYAVLLLLFRPAMPFEWDEVLFQRSLDEYNVAAHSPHPPGYPVFVAAARVARALTGDPLLALQLVNVLAAAAALLLVWWLAARVGGARHAGLAAALLLAAAPTFAFHANVGLSDVAGVALGVAAVATLASAMGDLTRLPWAAAAGALALGVRPALLPLLVPLGVVVVWRAVRVRGWRVLAVSAVVGLVTSDLIWLPAMYASGPDFWPAWKTQASYAAAIGVTQRLPGAPLATVLDSWLVRPFGSPGVAGALWALVAVGAVAWWRAGRRTLVGVAAASGGAYLATALFTLEAPVAVRYVLPAVPFLAVLAAGVTVLPSRVARRAAAVAAVGWCAAALYWGASTYALRRRPAPAWAALCWIAEHADPARTTVVYDGFFEPHAYYLLGDAGFQLVKAEQSRAYGAWLRPGGTVLYVAPKAVAGGEVLFAERWQSARLRQMTRGRYDEAAVTRAPAPGQPVFSPDLRVRGDDWELYGTASVCLGEQAAPRVVVVEAAAVPLRVRRAALPPLTVKPGGVAEPIVWPGDGGCLLLTGAAGAHTHLPPLRTSPAPVAGALSGVAPAVVVPLVAKLPESGESAWRTDVYVHNAGTARLPVVAQFLPQGRDNGEAPTITFAVGPGAGVVSHDVLAETGLGRWGEIGALLVYPDPAATPCPAGGCGLSVFSRTYNARAARVGPRLGEGLPAIPAGNGLYPGGRATFEHVANDDATLGYVSIATWMPVAARARLSLRDADRQEVAAAEVALPPFGHVFAPFPGRVTDGQLWVQLVKPPANALFYPAVTLVNRGTREPVHLLAAPAKRVAPPEWLLATSRRLPPPPDAGGRRPAARR